MLKAPKNTDEFRLKRYEQLTNEAFHAEKVNWTINSIFITASLVMTGYLFTKESIPNEHRLYIVFVIFILLWYVMFVHVGISRVCHTIFRLINEIVESYEMTTFPEKDTRKILNFNWRNIYFTNIFIFSYNCLLAFYCWYTISKCRAIILFVANIFLIGFTFFLEKKDKK